MKKIGVVVFFDHSDGHIYGDLKIPEKSGLFTITRFFFDESTSYEEMVESLTQGGRFMPLDDPRLRYNLVLQAFEASWLGDKQLLPRSLSKPVTLRERQTLASTHLTQLVMDEVEFTRSSLQKYITVLFCAASIEIRDSSLPKEKSSSPPPNWGQIINAFLMSLAANAINFTASLVTITTTLIVIERWWQKKHAAYSASLQGRSSQLPESEIVAIRLLMTDGTEHKIEEWLTDSARLKHYIDVFNQPSSTVKPLQAIFVLKKGRPIIVDVSQDVQNNLQLNELLSYLNIDSPQQ